VANLDSEFVRWAYYSGLISLLLWTVQDAITNVLDYEKAQKYLRVFGKELANLKSIYKKNYAELIDQFLGR